jgi:ABC-type amino acid transport substrate-binding protein
MKKTLRMRICAATVATIATLSGVCADELVAPKVGASPTADQIRTDGVFRAGVIINAPFIMQDPINNEYTGPAADFINAAATGLGAKVEWVPVNWDTMIAGLQAKQYQVLATAVYAVRRQH